MLGRTPLVREHRSGCRTVSRPRRSWIGDGMPGVARGLGKAGVAIGLGLVLIGPSAQGADAILPAPGTTAVGAHAVPEVTAPKVKTKAKTRSKQKSRSKAAAKHGPNPSAARQVQIEADLQPGVYTIVTHPARTGTHPAGTKPGSPATTHPRKHPRHPGTTPTRKPRTRKSTARKTPARKLPTRSKMNPVDR